ncbi:nucleotide pyrophosphohydrolase [Stenotrophomonas indicatrix]|uniref:nucleotide pyrophosphohydrolase n=1 Tax=Stenotrophomonas indicatrix TaxID=2045451 RepID=UPI000C1A587D|nr:nucleotide pyrophosphohydrolase [Stenotrophomonas indicatrix]PII13222.1 nucleotide pyrophosphohydrolase [Stenotrophomonas indicatrix]
MDLEKIQSIIRDFRDERDWKQFHNPKNMAISISLEAAELLEHFQWRTPDESMAHAKSAKDEIALEMADIAIYLIEMADDIGIDLEGAILAKLELNRKKYPADKARGNAKKYTELDQ